MIIFSQQSCAERAQPAWTLSAERPAYGAGLWLASGNVNFESIPSTLTDKSSTLCQNCLGKQYGLLQTPAFLLESGIWVQAEGAYVTNSQ